MKEVWNWIQIVVTAIGGVIGSFLGAGSPGGSVDGFLYALIVFVIIDYITGVMVGISQKKLSSEIGFKGIFKKVLIFLLVGIGSIIDTKILGEGNVVRTAVVFFYLSNEGISILENVSVIGLPIPQKLKDVLEQLNKEEK